MLHFRVITGNLHNHYNHVPSSGKQLVLHDPAAVRVSKLICFRQIHMMTDLCNGYHSSHDNEIGTWIVLTPFLIEAKEAQSICTWLNPQIPISLHQKSFSRHTDDESMHRRILCFYQAPIGSTFLHSLCPHAAPRQGLWKLHKNFLSYWWHGILEDDAQLY